MSRQGEKAWDVVPPEARGDPTPDAIYKAVGTALSAWERLSQMQGSIFEIMVNSRDGAAGRAYGLVSYSTQCLMIAEAAHAIFRYREPLLVELKSLVGDLNQLCGRRNDIAHGVAMEHSFIDGDVKTSVGYYLVPGWFSTRKRLSNAKIDEMLDKGIWQEMVANNKRPFSSSYAFTSVQIMQYADRFAIYREQMAALSSKLTEALGTTSPPK